MREFVDVDMGREAAPDETTICKFRHPPKAHTLGQQVLAMVNADSVSQGFRVSTGTIVDATIIAAPPSTKNSSGKRDPEMHLAKRGIEWHCGTKAYVGVDNHHKITHSVAASAATVQDSLALPMLLHGKETSLWGDSAYQGQTAVIHKLAPHTRDFRHRRYRYQDQLDLVEQRKNRNKSRLRAKGEHPPLVLKPLFGFAKVRHLAISPRARSDGTSPAYWLISFNRFGSRCGWRCTARGICGEQTK